MYHLCNKLAVYCTCNTRGTTMYITMPFTKCDNMPDQQLNGIQHCMKGAETISTRPFTTSGTGQCKGHADGGEVQRRHDYTCKYMITTTSSLDVCWEPCVEGGAPLMYVGSRVWREGLSESVSGSKGYHILPRHNSQSLPQLPAPPTTPSPSHNLQPLPSPTSLSDEAEVLLYLVRLNFLFCSAFGVDVGVAP